MLSLMICPRTRGAMPTTFARAIASSVRGCCSMMCQTQNVNRTAPRITMRLIMRPAGLRHALGFGGGVGSEFGGAAGAEALGGVAEVSIRVSGFETDKPYGHGPEDHHEKVNETRRTQLSVELEADQNLTSDA